MTTKDRRLYAKFDIGMDEHAKIMFLSDAAFRALFESTLYARRQLTDGFLDSRIVARKWSAESVAELTSNDPERPSWIKVDGGYQIHDFAEHQVTTKDIDAKREAGRKGGLAKPKQNASTTEAPASKVLEQIASTSLAKTETETETETRRKDLSTEPADEFAQWYARYPRKEAKDAAKRAFTKARKSASLPELLSGLDQYNRAMAGKERQYLALPATWLNAGRWQDEIPTTTKPAASSPWNQEFYK